MLGDAGRRAFAAALASMADCRQLLLVSTVPLVNPHLTLLEHCFNAMPGHQSWQDDLVDQWPSAAHRSELRDLLRTLVDFSARTGVRVTSLSGEIHLGALGVIESGPTATYQLTSSGIVHPPPSPAVATALEWIGARTTRLAPDLTARLLPLPGLGRRFLRARNWLELELPGGDALTATWHSEGPSAASRLTLGRPAADTVTPRAAGF